MRHFSSPAEKMTETQEAVAFIEEEEKGSSDSGIHSQVTTWVQTVHRNEEKRGKAAVQDRDHQTCIGRELKLSRKHAAGNVV